MKMKPVDNWDGIQLEIQTNLGGYDMNVYTGKICEHFC